MATERLMAGHQKFRELFSNHRNGFKRLADEGQSPQVLWIGCSDSRVIPEQVTGLGPGELFIMRNIANIVPPFGTSDAVGSVIEYAVLHLHVPHIVICGHTECGGIKATLEGHADMEHEPHITRWIEMAKTACAHAQTTGETEDERYLEAIKKNVLNQWETLKTYSFVNEKELENQLTIHGYLYDLHTGDLMEYDKTSDQWDILNQLQVA